MKIKIDKFKGMSDVMDEIKLPDNAFRSLINIRPSVTSLEKIDGYKKLSKTQTGQGILAVNQLIHASGSKDIYVHSSDRILKYNTTTLALDDFTTMADEGLQPLSPDNAGMVYQDKLFIADKANEPYFISGQSQTGQIKEKIVVKIKLVSSIRIELVDPNDETIIYKSFDVASADTTAMTFLCQRGEMVYIQKSRTLIMFDKNQNKIILSRMFVLSGTQTYMDFSPQDLYIYASDGLKIYKIDYVSLNLVAFADTNLYKNIPASGQNAWVYFRKDYFIVGSQFLNMATDTFYTIAGNYYEMAPARGENRLVIQNSVWGTATSFFYSNLVKWEKIPFIIKAAPLFIHFSETLFSPKAQTNNNINSIWRSSPAGIISLLLSSLSTGQNTWTTATNTLLHQYINSGLIAFIKNSQGNIFDNTLGYETVASEGYNQEKVIDGSCAYSNYEVDLSISSISKLFKVGAPPKIIPYRFGIGTVTAGTYKFSQSYKTLLGESWESPLSSELILNGSLKFKLFFGLIPSNYPYEITQRFIYIHTYNTETLVWDKKILDSISDELLFEKEYSVITYQEYTSIQKYNLLPKCTIVEKHLDRLCWAGDVNAPNAIYASEVRYPEAYTTDGFRIVYHNDGDIIKAIKSIYDRAYVFKERNIYVIIGDMLDVQATVLKVEEGKGCIAPKTALIIGSAIFFLSDIGVCVLVQDKVKELSDGIIDLDKYTKDELRVAFADYDEENGDYRVYIKDDILKYNIANKAFYYDQKVNQKYSCSSMVIMENKKRILFATDERYVFIDNEGLFFDTEKRFCRAITKKFNAGDNYTKLLLSNLKLNAQLNSDLIIYNERAVKRIKPAYKQEYDLRLKNFFGKNLQINMFEQSLYDFKLNNFLMELQ